MQWLQLIKIYVRENQLQKSEPGPGFEPTTIPFIGSSHVYYNARCCYFECIEYFLFYQKKIKFFTQRSRKTRDLQKKLVWEIWQKYPKYLTS